MQVQVNIPEKLRVIGGQLDQNLFPIVYDGGIVEPSENTDLPSTMGKEYHNDRSRERRPPTGSWERPPGRQRQAYRSRSARGATPFVLTSLRNQYEAELGAVYKAYPDTKSWLENEGMWLLTESTLLRGLGKKATFLTMVPYVNNLAPRSWGFWTTPIFVKWIGPRHTNFPDGSICAFEPQDKTWVSGDSIVKILDLYSLWALRHLYLEIFGKWPGYQSVPHPYERLTELKDNEFCGCANSARKYVDCCKKHDLARDKAADK